MARSRTCSHPIHPEAARGVDRVRYGPEAVNGGVHNGVELAVVYFGTARRFFSFAKTR